jgi:hypothetical protein
LRFWAFLQYRNPKASDKRIQLEDIKFHDKEGNKLTIMEFYDSYQHEKLTRCNPESKTEDFT